MEMKCGPLTFFSNFDSGNLARVERVQNSETKLTCEGKVLSSESNANDKSVDLVVRATVKDKNGSRLSKSISFSEYFLEYNLWTTPDCGGTVNENGNRTWFYFGVKGCIFGKTVAFNIMNMNKQGKLYGHGMAPFVKIVPGQNKWQRIKERPSYEIVDDQFHLSFAFRFPDQKFSVCYFAFCYPYSYEDVQLYLDEFDKKFSHQCETQKDAVQTSTIYYHRELICNSIDGLRVDLLTVSSRKGILEDLEPRLAGLFPDLATRRANQFKGKKVFILTSRVHPGETPSSYVFKGFLDFITRQDDLRAAALRDRFVFKLIPLLNPDGVKRGHYRTDQMGVNLNRVYLDPNPKLHPTIFAAKSLVAYHYNGALSLVNVCDNMQLKHFDIARTEEASESDKSENSLVKSCSSDLLVLQNSKDLEKSVHNTNSNSNDFIEEDIAVTSQVFEEKKVTKTKDKVDDNTNFSESIKSRIGHKPPENVSVNLCDAHSDQKRLNIDISKQELLENTALSQNVATVGSSVKENFRNVEGLENNDNHNSTLDKAIEQDSKDSMKNSSSLEGNFNSSVLKAAVVASLNDHQSKVSATCETNAKSFVLTCNDVNNEYSKVADSSESSSFPEQSNVVDDLNCGAVDTVNSGDDSNEMLSNPSVPPSSPTGVKMIGQSVPNSSEFGNLSPTKHSQDSLSTDGPADTELAFYVDLHGHASKKGCFIYGNYIADEEQYEQCLLFPKLISINSSHFDFTACNFSEKNMYSRDRRDGMSKEGSGRVAIHKMTGLCHCYTLECNYNSGRSTNVVPPATRDNGRATPPPPPGFPPRYTPEIYEEVGRALAVSALDILNANPWSRLPLSEYSCLEGVKDWVRRYIKSNRNASLSTKKGMRFQAKTTSVNNSNMTHLPTSGIDSLSSNAAGQRIQSDVGGSQDISCKKTSPYYRCPSEKKEKTSVTSGQSKSPQKMKSFGRKRLDVAKTTPLFTINNSKSEKWQYSYANEKERTGRSTCVELRNSVVKKLRESMLDFRLPEKWNEVDSIEVRKFERRHADNKNLVVLKNLDVRKSTIDAKKMECLGVVAVEKSRPKITKIVVPKKGKSKRGVVQKESRKNAGEALDNASAKVEIQNDG